MFATNYWKIRFHWQITLQSFYEHHLYCTGQIINENTAATGSERYWTAPNTSFLCGRGWLISQWVLTKQIDVSYRSCFLCLLMRISLEIVFGAPFLLLHPVPQSHQCVTTESQTSSLSVILIQICADHYLLLHCLLGACKQILPWVISVFFWILKPGFSDLPFPNSSFSAFSRDRHHACSFPVFWRKFLCPPQVSWRNCPQL